MLDRNLMVNFIYDYKSNYNSKIIKSKKIKAELYKSIVYFLTYVITSNIRVYKNV